MQLLVDLGGQPRDLARSGHALEPFSAVVLVPLARKLIFPFRTWFRARSACGSGSHSGAVADAIEKSLRQR